MSSTEQTIKPQGFRLPAVPLVTVDPYFCVWSMADTLTEDWTKHWTSTNNSMSGMAFIDGKPFRFAGTDHWSIPKVPAMEQKKLEVYPTRSIYTFEVEGVEITLNFMTPLLLDDLDIMSRGASYVQFTVKSTDGNAHDVTLYFDVTGEWVVDLPNQKVTWGSYKIGGENPIDVLRIGSQDQQILDKTGDNRRIDWGYLHLTYQSTPDSAGATGTLKNVRKKFIETGSLPESDDMNYPAYVDAENPVLACTFDLGKVSSEPVSKVVTLVYDDVYSAEYFHRKMRPYWRRNGMDATGLIKVATEEFPELLKKCEEFDAEILADAEKVGGSDYADIVTASYRQAIAAHKLAADYLNTPYFFSKENFSNGCMATVDVTYPSAPMFLLFNTKLLKGMLLPIIEYSESPLWPNDFAPHDLGVYPRANGQVYGDVTVITNQMPVEESGNMLILLAAMSYRDGNADFAAEHWDTLTMWAAYLKNKGLDPENQLCTDDFAGHLAHNTNLSLKAITGIACYSLMADMLGKKDVAVEYRKAAEEMAKQWKEMAFDGDHYKLAFDQPGTWSMKYNLVWDKILGLNLFDPEIAKTEIEHYKKVNNTYGVPLDSRKEYTKGDWLSWIAILSDDEDFKTLIAPLRKYLNETPGRVPFCDWHWTTDGNKVNMQARSVVGGVFIKLLTDENLWKKWSSRAK